MLTDRLVIGEPEITDWFPTAMGALIAHWQSTLANECFVCTAAMSEKTERILVGSSRKVPVAPDRWEKHLRCLTDTHARMKQRSTATAECAVYSDTFARVIDFAEQTAVDINLVCPHFWVRLSTHSESLQIEDQKCFPDLLHQFRALTRQNAELTKMHTELKAHNVKLKDREAELTSVADQFKDKESKLTGANGP